MKNAGRKERPREEPRKLVRVGLVLGVVGFTSSGTLVIAYFTELPHALAITMGFTLIVYGIALWAWSALARSSKQ